MKHILLASDKKLIFDALLRSVFSVLTINHNTLFLRLLQRCGPADNSNSTHVPGYILLLGSEALPGRCHL
jgi:hypothetical protein